MWKAMNGQKAKNRKRGASKRLSGKTSKGSGVRVVGGKHKQG